MSVPEDSRMTIPSSNKPETPPHQKGEKINGDNEGQDEETKCVRKRRRRGRSVEEGEEVLRGREVRRG